MGKMQRKGFKMQKLLYITDQMEYAENSFIKSLFRVYLNKYFDVKTIFFSKFKHGVEIREDGQILVSEKYKSKLFSKLKEKNIDVCEYDFVIVRNDGDILRQALKLRENCKFKIGFRLSFPKRMAQYRKDEAQKSSSLLTLINNKLSAFNETNLINKCDIFFPTSKQMKEDYFQDVNIKTYELPSAIDPKGLQEKTFDKSETIKFFYIGTFDKLRSFSTVLNAFNDLKDENFILMLATKETQYRKTLLEKFPDLTDKIELYEVKNNKEYHDLVDKSDIGISLLPDMKLFNSSTPIKIFDFYSWGTPCILSDNNINRSIFDDNISAWFSTFDEASISKKLKYIISLSKEDIRKVGKNGQEKLLEVRNYETIAKNLSEELKSLK